MNAVAERLETTHEDSASQESSTPARDPKTGQLLPGNQNARKTGNTAYRAAVTRGCGKQNVTKIVRAMVSVALDTSTEARTRLSAASLVVRLLELTGALRPERKRTHAPNADAQLDALIARARDAE